MFLAMKKSGNIEAIAIEDHKSVDPELLHDVVEVYKVSQVFEVVKQLRPKAKETRDEIENEARKNTGKKS
jgi:hypothetical protein